MTKAPSGGAKDAFVEMTLAEKVFVAPRCPLGVTHSSGLTVASLLRLW